MCVHVCACDRAHVCACACACVRRGQERRLLEGTVSQLGPGGPGREPHQPAGPWSLSCPPRCPATRVFSANRSLFPLCPAAPFIPLGARPGPAQLCSPAPRSRDGTWRLLLAERCYCAHRHRSRPVVGSWKQLNIGVLRGPFRWCVRGGQGRVWSEDLDMAQDFFFFWVGVWATLQGSLMALRSEMPSRCSGGH